MNEYINTYVIDDINQYQLYRLLSSFTCESETGESSFDIVD